MIYYNILVSREELDLNKTFNSGQAFRWRNEDGYWVGVVGSTLCVLRQFDNYIETNLPLDKRDIIIKYLNLDMNYNKEISKLDLDSYALTCYNKAKGIHILRQDYFEVMVTFLMSSCNTMTRIRNIVNSLCREYGVEITTKFNNRDFKGYTFPTIESLRNVTREDLDRFSMGFRADYLISMIDRLNNNSYILDNLHKGIDGSEKDRNDAIWILNSFKGIGSKVANCISLFAGHHLSSFPIDTHIAKILEREYKGSINLNIYGDIAGVIQQYMYYNEAFK